MKKNEKVGNFFVVCNKVFLLPKDESNISHDMPFSNSYCGLIKIRIKTLSPLYIRNHYQDGDEFYERDGERISMEFCHYNGKPYIPGSSIKGMVRSVLEIFSYAKLANKIAKEYHKKLPKDTYPLHYSDKLDLSEAIFGTTELKGRVHFSHFIATSYKIDKKPIETILMTPAAKDKMGWKRYPKQPDIKTINKKNNETVITKFKPIRNGTFTGEMRFHNLRDYELGALLSALSFHNTNNSVHLLGMGKSQGFGKIKLEFDFNNKIEVMKQFELKMQTALSYRDGFWHKSRYIKEMFKRHIDKKIEYPKTLIPIQKYQEIEKTIKEIKDRKESWETIDKSSIKELDIMPPKN